MDLPLLLHAIVGSPLAISARGMAELLAIANGQVAPRQRRRPLSDRLQLEAIQAYDDEPLEDTHTAEVRDGVAIMLVRGPMMRHASSFRYWFSNATSYGELRKDFQRALDDSSVRAILWDFDSPGGQVNGLAELGEAIYAARGKKPMRAYASGDCCSAAYWLASAVGDIRCSPTSELGSIGCKMLYFDDTKALDEIGYKRVEIVSSNAPGKASDPSDPDYKKRLQAQCNEYGALFAATVAQYRDVALDAVQSDYGKGDVLIGASAVEAGLCDGLSNFEAVLAEMKASTPSGRGGRANYFPGMGGANHMDTKIIAKLLKLEEGASEREIEDRAQSLAQFEREVLAAAGSTDPDEAVGNVRAGIEALKERDELRADLKAQKHDTTQSEFRRTVKKALKSRKLTLGQVATHVVPFLKEEEAAKATAAIAAVPEQTKKLVLDALCTAQASPKALKKLQAFLSKQTEQLPTGKDEPPPDDASRAQVLTLSSDQAKQFGKDYGLKQETISKFLNVTSVEDIHKAHKAAVDAKK